MASRENPTRRDRATVRTWSRLLALSSVLGLAVVACGSGSSGGTSASGGATGSSPNSTLVIANAVKVDTLDPEANSVNESIWLDQNLYSRLYQSNPDGTQLTPDLATGYTVSDHNKVYTFHLRKAEFSDGTPVTAQDVVWSINRARKFAGGWGFLLTAVKSTTAPNPSTVVFTLSQPHAPLVADLAMYAYSVLPEAEVKAQGAKFFQHPVGSGPFHVTSYNPDSEVDLAVNPHWYGTKPKISAVKILIVPNDNTRVLLLQSKKADVIENPPSNLVSEIDASKTAKVDLFPSTRVDFIQLDEHYKPFDNADVRLALNYAIDRAAIVQIAYQGHATPGSSFFPLDMQYYDKSIQPYPYDPTKAKQLLAAGGYPNGFKTFLITVSGDVAGQATAVILKQELAKVGIDVDIQSYELTTAYAKEDNGHSEMGERYWTNDIIDPDEVATFGADGKGGANAFNSYWNIPAVDNKVAAARETLVPATRQSLYSSIQQTVYTQTPFLVTDYSPFRYGVGDWVHGFAVTPLGNYNLSLEQVTVDNH